MTRSLGEDQDGVDDQRPVRPSTGAVWAGLVAWLGLAASAAGDTAPPRFTQLSVQDGLSQSSVETILQDRDGFLWFGTQEGLNRYDGYRFTVHRARDQPGFLKNHIVTALIDDQRGDLWVGTAAGLHRYERATGRFDLVATGDAPLRIVGLVEDAQGRILFTTSDGALWLIEEPAHGWRPARLEGGGIEAGSTVGALAHGGGSTVWAAADGRLLRIEAEGPESRPRAREVLRDLGSIRVLACDPAGHVWIGARERALLRYRPADRGVDAFPEVPSDVLALRPGGAGELWIGARAGGLARLDTRTGRVLVHRHDPGDPTSVSRDDVAAIYEDRVGILWVGVWAGGVNRLDPYAQAFRTLRRRPHAPESFAADSVIALAEATDGRLWVASRSGVLAVGDPESGRFRIAAAPLAGRGRPYSLGWLGARVLVGTGRGLVAVEPASGNEVALDAPLRAHGLHERPIAAVKSTPGAAWIASGPTVCRLTHDPGSGTAAHCREAPIANGVHALAAPGPDRAWIGSETGDLAVAEWDRASAAIRFRRLELRDDSSARAARVHGEISALYEDPHGRLWVGTRQGLGRTDPMTGATRWLGEHDGLPSTTVAGLAGGSDGFIWIAHNSGLTRIDPVTGAMSHFGEREGAQGTGYAEGAWAAGASGRLYFAGQGITAFDPRAVLTSPHRPGIAFTGLEILRRPVSPRWRDPASPIENAIDSVSEVTLGPAATVVSVEMAALHYVDPPSNRIVYRLEGFDPEWIEADAQHRVATYTRLPPGSYLLHARARTKNGLWSEGEARLAIRILAPWWRTRTALGAWGVLAIAAAGLAWAAVRHSMRARLALLERETLRRESLTDPLTGLYNRRFLAAHLELELPKLFREYQASGPSALGSSADLLLVVIDVDRFKAINDRYSHAAGDRTLASIAGVLRQHIRDSDLAIRWGGDEFLVVSHSIRRADAAASVERLRRAVEDLGLSLVREGGPSCTLSIGYAAFPLLVGEPKALTWEQTLHLADHALLLTKRRRRNSHTGLRARPGLESAAVLEFLNAAGAVPLPDGIEIVIPEERSEKARAAEASSSGKTSSTP